MYSVKILADSYSSGGDRLTTFEITFPRFLLAEFNTHRALSRNSASSRAIPTEKLIDRAKKDPFLPDFNRRVKGMGVGEPLSAEQQGWAKDVWLSARNDSVRSVEALVNLNVDKSRANRLLEPILWHTAIVTATDWSNFLALRTDEDAQPEFRKLALMMREVYRTNIPWYCPHECWHLPLCDLEEMGDPIDYDYWKRVCTGRCARVSYLTHDGRRDTAEDVGLHHRLLDRWHLSPFEHPARPFSTEEWEIIRAQQADLRTLYAKRLPKQVERWCRQLEYCGNLHGWQSYRAEIPNEYDYSLAKAANVPS